MNVIKISQKKKKKKKSLSIDKSEIMPYYNYKKVF